MTQSLLKDVNAAIENLRPSFEADNFRLTLDSLSDSGDVVVALEAGPDACSDCLVPDPMLKHIVDVAVRRFAPTVTSVAVVKRGFDTSPSTSS